MGRRRREKLLHEEDEQGSGDKLWATTTLFYCNRYYCNFFYLHFCFYEAANLVSDFRFPEKIRKKGKSKEAGSFQVDEDDDDDDGNNAKNTNSNNFFVYTHKHSVIFVYFPE